MARNGPITISDLRAAQEAGIKQGKQESLASHDNRQFKSVPATGAAGDQPAGQQWKDLLKDESLLKTIERLKISSERTNTGGITGKEFKTPAEGPGGYKDYPYDDFGNYRGPSVPGHPDWAISHGKHKQPDGWSMPSDTHDPEDHKQYDPGGEPLFNPLDGGEVLPWDQKPITISSLSPAALKALKAATEKGLSSKQIRDLIKPFTKPDQFGHPSGSLI